MLPKIVKLLKKDNLIAKPINSSNAVVTTQLLGIKDLLFIKWFETVWKQQLANNHSIFSKDIAMEFDIRNCAYLTMKAGKFVCVGRIALSNQN